MASILLPERVKEVETFLVRHIRRAYEIVLPLAVRRYRIAAARSASASSLVCGVLGARLGTEFLPKLEEGNIWIRALLPPTITLEAGMDSVARMRNIIRSYPPVRTVVSEQGRGEDGTDPDGSFVAEFFVPLKPLEEWPKGLTKEEMVQQMSEQLKREFVGVDFNFSQYIQDNIEEAVSGVKGENSVKIFGRDLAELERLSKALQDRDRDRARRDQSRRLQPARPAQSHDQDRPRQGGALRLLGRRHQLPSCRRRSAARR